MSTKPFSAQYTDLHVGAPAVTPSGNMTIKMLQNKWYTDGALLKKDNSYVVTIAWGREAVDKAWAVDISATLPEQTLNSVSNLQSAANVAANVRTDLPKGADLMIGPVESYTLTGAMSTTVSLSVTATGNRYTARIQTTNNGASGTAKFNIAVNCGNDVEGLVASQSALQRDAQITMGDAILLVSPVPITRVNLSSDTALLANTYFVTITLGD